MASTKYLHKKSKIFIKKRNQYESFGGAGHPDVQRGTEGESTRGARAEERRIYGRRLSLAFHASTDTHTTHKQEL